MPVPKPLWRQFEERCEALGMTKVEALRNWLDSNPAPIEALREVDVTHLVPGLCPDCRGTGMRSAFDYCPKCEGSGRHG